MKLLGEVPWGTHLCLFYKTGEDLLDILAPYFKAGLASNEFCMWVTSEPLTVDDARGAMRALMPDFDRYAQEGRMEIIPYTEWYMKDGYFDIQRVFDGWLGKLDGALAAGMEGLRATGNTAWLEDADWASFTEYEEFLNKTIGDYPMMAICTYSLDLCNASEVIDVVSNHQFAMIKREGDWELIESSETKRVESEYRTVVQTAIDGYWVVNMQGQILDVNDAYCEMISYSREELLKMAIGDIEAVEDTAETRARIEQVKGSGSDRFETRHRRKDGVLIDVEVSVRYLDTSGGRLFVFIRDITERKKYRQELERANAELDGYAHTVSHDLRNPLSAIAISCRMMRDTQGEGDDVATLAEADEFAGVVERNIERCYSLVNDLLALAEAGQRPSETETVDVRAVVARVEDERAAEIEARGIQIHVDDDLGTLDASPTHVYQVFANLINNAIRHNDAEKPVVYVSRVGAEEDGGIRYLVRDNGSGIAEEDLDRIFIAFVKRGDQSDTGIGLATVEKIVGVYNGEIRAYNDGGACFELVLRSL